MKYISILLLALTAVSCAGPARNIQPQINALVAARRFDRALSFLADDPSLYGKHNGLLYWLDKGMAAQLAGHYQDSIAAFSAAQQKYDELYTRSMTQMASTWVVNDYAQDYRGDDHEYVLAHVLQALNFAVQGNIDEALVEARRVDQALDLINARYKPGQKNVYSDDAFARFLAGILWEATGTPEGINDAYIAYTRAMALYEHPPQVLKDNYAATKAFMEQGTRPASGKAEVYVFEYTGYAPLKVSDSFPLPLDSGHITKISFPRYFDRISEVRSSRVTAIRGQQERFVDTEIGHDIGGTARKILAGRKAMILAKAGLRPLAKYAAEKAAEISVRREHGNLPADALNILASVYNLATEEADLRGWQTLPDEIRVAKLVLEPGEYELFMEDLDEHKGLLEKRPLGRFTFKSGEKKFLISRGSR
ncbi:MAG: hypothetical protein HY591_03260 [Candidatus Omnitrophica bacterium]|nr:hypothetical protein [Candidatus Omnitrophota bacterium]